jgi:N4-gp56 family major capsid protein
VPAPTQTTTDSGLAQAGVTTVYDLAVLEAYRSKNIFRRFADVKWSESAAPVRGNPVTFTLITALSTATSALAETTEPTPVTLNDSQKTITLAEYGNAIKRTNKASVTSMFNLEMADVREIAANMEESVDIIARDILVAGTQVYRVNDRATRGAVVAGDTFTANQLRRARAFLMGKNTPYMPGADMYVGVIHPDVSYDLQVESGNQAWIGPHVNVDTNAIYTGEIGALGGVRVVENANAKIFVDAGAGSTVDVYITLVMGFQALGEAVGTPQHVVISGPFDDLQRFVSVGWYGLLGFGRIRENSLVRIESSSSLATNV